MFRLTIKRYKKHRLMGGEMDRELNERSRKIKTK